MDAVPSKTYPPLTLRAVLDLHGSVRALCYDSTWPSVETNPKPDECKRNCGSNEFQNLPRHRVLLRTTPKQTTIRHAAVPPTIGVATWSCFARGRAAYNNTTCCCTSNDSDTYHVTTRSCDSLTPKTRKIRHATAPPTIPKPTIQHAVSPRKSPRLQVRRAGAPPTIPKPTSTRRALAHQTSRNSNHQTCSVASDDSQANYVTARSCALNL